ncbi:MAG: hypothetical protein AAF387_04910 [Pseudomonadota bacterium]
MLSAEDENSALEYLHDAGCTDGLPVVIPTVARVDRMILASGLETDMEIASMGPQWGSGTVEKIAVAAVMAGCLPDHFAVVLAAVKAISQDAFDLAEMQCTTHCIHPMLIVNGPARMACGGISSGFGALGPGHRANASIGRALRLAMMNIGGAKPGVSDMAIHGHPGKFTCCFAEDEEHSPLEPFHTTFGYEPQQSAVTVLGVEGPHSVLFSGDAHDPKSADNLMNAIAGTIANVGSNNSHLGGTAAVGVMLNPDHANVLANNGFDRRKIQQTLASLAVTPREDLLKINPKMLIGDEAMIPAVRDPNNIHVFVAGGSGLYTMVMPSWCAGPHGNQAVHEEIIVDQFCELPSA